VTLPVLRLTVPHVLELAALSYETLANKTAGWHYMYAIKAKSNLKITGALNYVAFFRIQ